MNKTTMLKCVLILCFICFGNLIHAQHVWTGNFDNSWTDARNWNQSSPPSASSDVIINNVSKNPSISTTVSVRSIKINSGGRLEVDGPGRLNISALSGFAALDNRGTVYNQGDIYITGTSNLQNGIYTTGTFTNFPAGPGRGGRVDVNNVGTYGIRVQNGTFDNSGGTVNIGNSGSIGWAGLYILNGIFNNTAIYDVFDPLTPVLNISNTGTNGITTWHRLVNNGGRINIGVSGSIAGEGIYFASGSMTNESNTTDPANPMVGIITVNNTIGNGISLIGDSPLSNKGTISIGENNAIGGIGLHVASRLINEQTGLIKINNSSDEGLLNEDNFSNAGTIRIGGVHTINDIGFRNDPGSFGSFTNQATGRIFVDRTNLEGVVVGAGDFHNYGEINIGKIGSITRHGIRVDYDLDNLTGGKIYIDNVTNASYDAIYAEGNVYNIGDIIIGSRGPIAGDGLLFYQLSFPAYTFTNAAGGKLEIDQTGGHGISNYFDTFSNSGSIIIGATGTIGGLGVRNLGTINNNASGELIVHRAAGTSGIRNFHHFTNNGIIEIGELGDIRTYAINNENFGSAWFSNASCSAVIIIHSDDIIADLKNSFTNSGLIIENASGTSDIQTNNGIIANLNGGSFNVASGGGKFIGNVGDKLWLGCSDTDWSNADNWYPREIPQTRDVVYIDGLNNDPSIGPSIIAFGGSLHIEAGETLTNQGKYSGYSDIIIANGATASGNGDYALGRNWENNGSFVAGTSRVTFNGPADATIGGSSSNDFYELVSNKLSSTVSVQEDCSVSEELLAKQGELNILNGKEISGDALVLVQAPGSLSNNGTLSCDSLSIQNNGVLNNSGDIDVDGGILNKGSMQGNGSYECGRFSMESTGSITLDGVLDVEGDIRSSGSLGGGGTYYCGESWVISGGSFASNTSKLVMDGSTYAYVYFYDSDIGLYDFEIDKSAGSVVEVFGGFDVLNETLIKGGTLFIPSGNNMGFENLTINPAASLDLQGGFSLYGNITNNGTLISTSLGFMNCMGDAQQQLGGSSPLILGRLFINKTSNEAQLDTDCEVYTRVQMFNANLDLNNHVLSLGGSIIGESPSSYIYGGGHISCTATLNAPNQVNLGNLGVEITSSANLGETSIKRYHQPQSLAGSSGIERYYDISPTNNSGLNAEVKFYYMDHELNGLTESSLTPYRYDGSNWSIYPLISNDVSANYVATQGVDAFSIWTLASSGIFPVELIDFEAKLIANNSALLSWQTALEINNEGFEIQHSTDGRDWQRLDFVAGMGTTDERSEYEYLHSQLQVGENYYRLKQVDYDGQFQYSGIEEVYAPAYDLQVYPNPASQFLKIDIPESYEIGKYQMFNPAGKMVQSADLDKGLLQEIPLMDLPKGNYVLKVELDGVQYLRKIMIQ
ncbi:MAG: T9SS type A sorting domain-containing protein [Bacteroidota bacterium]